MEEEDEAAPQFNQNRGISPQSLGALRGALEAALLRDPGEAAPPELPQVLGIPLPPPAKCRHLDGAQLLRDNLRVVSGGPPEGLGSLRTALSILEKYGRNLLQPRPPKHWRGVRFGNPVFRATVGAIKGGRGVLVQLGYTEQTGEGLRFPPEVGAPQGPLVASVTADVLILRAELDLLLANQHPNPQFFTQILTGSSEIPPLPDSSSEEEQRPPGTPRISGPEPGVGLGVGEGWSCPSCTFLNPSPRVLCGVCDRPRLARPPPPTQVWPCPHCTFLNSSPGPLCDVCHRSKGDPAPPPPPRDPSPHPSPPPPKPLGGPKTPPPTPKPTRAQRLLEEGQKVVAIVRAAESQGVPPEAVVSSALRLLGGGGGALGAESAVRGARGALGALLGALVELGVGEGQKDPGGPLGPLSLREAAKAWAKAQGEPQRALEMLLGTRRRQLAWLAQLGFPDREAAAQALFQSGGGAWGALGQLQRQRTQPMRERSWDTPPDIDLTHPDTQALARRILATQGVLSWGRALLVVTLGRELLGGTGSTGSSWGGDSGTPPVLGELLEAVGGDPDPDPQALRRRLRVECAVCGAEMPRNQSLSLLGCQCPLCRECFRLHFTIGVRERGVGALVCPACAHPDLERADEGLRMWHFSALDVQLRQCLDPQTYSLFTQKLTERELQRDPHFTWCCQCSFGFIFEGDSGPSRCPQCGERQCPRCLRQWDPHHSSLSCAEFGLWLRARDPQEASGGLGTFLQENGIACPRCGVWYALSRGGCMHFQCSQCQHQFCSGCDSDFYPRESCPHPGCPLRGSLHAHHPRQCLFYLRDWEPPRLQQLLRDGGVPFDTEPPEGSPGGGCGVLEQKETPGGLRDQPCGKETPPGMAGLCSSHYTEYLVRLLNSAALDPSPLYTPEELAAAAERHLRGGKPPQLPNETNPQYQQRLRDALAREAPVRPRPPPPKPPLL